MRRAASEMAIVCVLTACSAAPPVVSFDATPTSPVDAGGDASDAARPDATPSVCDAPRPPVPPALAQWLTGDPRDACVAPGGPAVLLMGGGFDVSRALTARAAPVIRGGDVVVLRTTGSDGYNDYLLDRLEADSVETLRVDTRTLADSDYVAWAVRSAELVWIAGGDQSDYLDAWDDTQLEDAIRDAYARGGVVGGTSAGLAVASEFIYDPDGVASATTPEAVEDPCEPGVQLATGFLGLSATAGVIADSHARERDRLGRLLVFMARIRAPGLPPTAAAITGVGIDVDTALFIPAAGHSVVDGDSDVYVLREDDQTVRHQVACGAPVVYTGVLRYRLRQNDWFDFSTGDSSVAPMRIGIDGRTDAIYEPPDPY